MGAHSNYGKGRDRLVAAAAELFYAQGVTASGVDMVVASAGVSKPTLYAHFRSKDELIAAALEWQHRQRRSQVEAVFAASSSDPVQQVLEHFDWLAQWHESNGCRGCAFLNAAPELVGPQHEKARLIVQQHKRWWRGRFEHLLAEAGLAEPERVADEVLLLFEGASARVAVEQTTEPVRTARRMAEDLLARLG
ncbi:MULTISPECIES: TetR/AcrR family transcriptional regulator [unclassified Streptomyces]|uniref:TetR/AcrR family transcriptional regulator n=1 Tax=unclassified Streptomyces TaxID=2593676 RepID=UPI002E1B1F31|nr:TetR/AcrR family transcriptional regulator [Streptomyces sp. NBC_01023]